MLVINFYRLFIKPRLYRLFSLTEEDRVIEQYKRGNARPLIRFFIRKQKFYRIDHRTSVSRTGRIVYERDIYDSIYIDGVYIGDFKVGLDVISHVNTVNEAKRMIASNIYSM